LTSPITENTTLKDLGLDVDYVYNGTLDLIVENDAVLTIEPGVCIQFTKKGGALSITDGATIKAKGTALKHIKFIGTGSEKGSWEGVLVSTITGNELDYVEILNAGSDGYDSSAALALINGKLAMTNSLINNSKANGIKLEGASGVQIAELTVFTGNTVSNCDKAPIYTTYYMGCYGLRNISNDNPFENWTGNISPYIHIEESTNTYLYGDFTIHSLKSYPWYFQSGLTIEDGFNVTVEPGTIIMIGARDYVRVDSDSHLICDGTADARITIKGFGNNAGFWNNLQINSQNPGSKFNYCDISDGGSGMYGLLYSYSGAFTNSYIEINNTNFSNSLNYGLYLRQYDINNLCRISSADPATVTFSNCMEGNIWSNCSGEEIVYPDLSSSCVLY
ncbi:MAG: hypothetical protein PHR20_09385, partial [Bacteroidales bacterium]|nr:hypothetical protein [Bacteroidales bacterium]